MIDRLAAIDRSSCSRGEHEAAEQITAALRDLAADAKVEHERVHGTYWWPLGITSGVGILAAIAARQGRRLTGAVLGAAAAAAVCDDLGAGRRVLRSMLPKQTTANVVARAGDPDASRTLVIVAHHDAAHTSVFFDPRITEFLGDRLQPRPDSPPRLPPMMAPIALAPAMVAAGSLAGLRKLVLLGAATCAGIIASFVEIALRPTVPGANDNLTGVATLLGIARALREQPVRGLRVLLVSTGAEESLMEGMRAFVARHLPDLARERTNVLCVDTVGSPNLVLADAEGMLLMRAYDREFNELVAACAAAQRVKLIRGLRMRLGTDGLLAIRHGFPAAMLTSVDRHGVPSNYHWPTDTPDRVDYERLEDAVRLCLAALHRLAGQEHEQSTVTPAASAGRPVPPRSMART